MKKNLLLLAILLIPLLASCGGKSSDGKKAPEGQVVFGSYVGDDREIFIMNADGSNKRNLSNDPKRRDQFPIASPDGQWIAYEGLLEEGDYLSDIYVVSAASEGGTPVNLTNGEASSYYPAWSPDSRQIVFASSTPGLYIVNVDGTYLHQVTTLSGTMPTADESEIRASNPSWSPDGTQILFEAYVPGNYSDLFVINADGTNLRRLSNTDGVSEDSPQWSPDGTKILYEFWDGDGEIYVMNADGTNPINLTNNDDEEANAAWSPDGSRIVFVRWGETWVMNADGSHAKQITQNHYINSSDYFPMWSKDGQWILFASDSIDSQSHVYIIGADGKNRTRLTYGQTWNGEAAWVPGGVSAINKQ